jgi:hypothetical protein
MQHRSIAFAPETETLAAACFPSPAIDTIQMADAIGRRGATRHRTPGRRESHRAMPTSDPGPSMARRWYSLS